MKKGLTYLTIAALSVAALAGSFGMASTRRHNRLHVQRVLPVKTVYDGKTRALNVPVYSEISQSKIPQCARYARSIAKDLFGKKYRPEDAWDLQYANRVVASVGEEDSLEKLADKGTLKPGMMVGVFNPDSKYNSRKDRNGRPVRYTHVITYLGDDPQTSEPLFADQFGKQTRVQTEEELRDGGLIPRQIIDSGN